MATADELLDGLPEVIDNTLTVDFNTRLIIIPVTLVVLGVEADDDVHRLKFRVPRYYGEFDLSKFKLHINYENARGKGDVYPVDDLETTDDDNITFSWLVDRFAFLYPGDVNFSICMKLYDNEGNVIKEFNTAPATLPVLEGLETSEATITSNPSLFDQVLFRLYAVETATGMGADGYYSVVKVDETDDGIAITVLSKDGNTEAVIRHGRDGVDAVTPVKGVDYYTEEEQTEFKNALTQYIDGWAPYEATVTLPATGWVDNQQTISVDRVTENNVIIVSAEETDEYYDAYNDACVRCIGQGINTLTFKCTSVPSVDLNANVVIFYSSDQTPSQGGITVSDDGNGHVTIL